MAEVGDIYEIRIVCTWSVQTSINVRHYRVTSKIGNGPLETEVAANFDQLFAPIYRTALATQATYRGVSAQKIRPLPPNLPAYTIANLGGGQSTGDAMPGQLSGLIRLKTDFGGPRYRGRLYVAFPSELQNDTTGVPTTAYVATIQFLADALNTVRTIGTVNDSANFVPVIFSRKYGTTADVKYCTGVQKWATMRSRGNYGDPNAPPF